MAWMVTWRFSSSRRQKQVPSIGLVGVGRVGPVREGGGDFGFLGGGQQEVAAGVGGEVGALLGVQAAIGAALAAEGEVEVEVVLRGRGGCS